MNCAELPGFPQFPTDRYPFAQIARVYRANTRTDDQSGTSSFERHDQLGPALGWSAVNQALCPDRLPKPRRALVDGRPSHQPRRSR